MEGYIRIDISTYGDSGYGSFPDLRVPKNPLVHVHSVLWDDHDRLYDS